MILWLNTLVTFPGIFKHRDNVYHLPSVLKEWAPQRRHKNTDLAQISIESKLEKEDAVIRNCRKKTGITTYLQSLYTVP